MTNGASTSRSAARKGLMMPPGMSFNALSPKSLEASKTAKLPKSFFS